MREDDGQRTVKCQAEIRVIFSEVCGTLVTDVLFGNDRITLAKHFDLIHHLLLNVLSAEIGANAVQHIRFRLLQFHSDTPFVDDASDFLFDFQEHGIIRIGGRKITAEPNLLLIIWLGKRFPNEKIIRRIIIDVIDAVFLAVHTKLIWIHVPLQLREQALVLCFCEQKFNLFSCKCLNCHCVPCTRLSVRVPPFLQPKLLLLLSL